MHQRQSQKACACMSLGVAPLQGPFLEDTIPFFFTIAKSASWPSRRPTLLRPHWSRMHRAMLRLGLTLATVELCFLLYFFFFEDDGCFFVAPSFVCTLCFLGRWRACIVKLVKRSAKGSCFVTDFSFRLLVAFPLFETFLPMAVGLVLIFRWTVHSFLSTLFIEPLPFLEALSVLLLLLVALRAFGTFLFALGFTLVL